MSFSPVYKQFSRSARVAVDDVLVENINSRGLRISFSVDRDKTSAPNNAEIVIYNLARDTRDRLVSHGKDGVAVRLEAGYGEHIQQLFYGVLYKVESIKDGASWLTRISAGDATSQIVPARFYGTFAKGTLISTILKRLAKSLGMGEGNIDSLSTLAWMRGGEVGQSVGLNSLPHAYSIAGPTSEELTALCAACGLEWSVQDGAFQILEVGQSFDNTSGPLLSPDSGLLGSPRLDVKNVVIGQCLLRPELMPGRAFKLQCATLPNGEVFVASQTRHYGDTNANTWFTDFKGVMIGKATPRKVKQRKKLAIQPKAPKK